MVTIDVGQENKASLKHQTNKRLAKRMTLLQPLDICNYFVTRLEPIKRFKFIATVASHSRRILGNY